MGSRALEFALRKLRGSGRLKNGLPSDDLSRIRRSIREGAIFSAKVGRARIIEAIRGVTERVLQKQMTPGQAREALRKAVKRTGYQAPLGKEGTIEDLLSEQRLALIVRTNRDMARGYGRWANAQRDLLNFPYWELYRAEQRVEPRDWPTRWAEAGGEETDGKMLAPINGAIWKAISAFGNPYPPFDFNSGMSVRRIARARIESLELRIPNQRQKPVPEFDSSGVDLPKDGRIASQLMRDLGKGYAVRNGKIVKTGP